jgi:hypothetical protein
VVSTSEAVAGLPLRDIEIKSDGLSSGTSILVDGSPVDNCVRVTWECGVAPGVATAILECDPAAFEGKARGLVLPSRDVPFRTRLRLALAVLRGAPSGR